MLNFSGQQSFDNKVNSSEDALSSNSDRMEATHLKLVAKHASPTSFVRISQTDLMEMENEIARHRNSLSQLAEENKGLILMQDCHIK